MSIDSLADAHGYVVRRAELLDLGISGEAFDLFRARRLPLGMRADQFGPFVASLRTALRRDGIRSYDVRLQGSAAHFFSGPHKSMPWSREAIIKEFRRGHRRIPWPHEVDGVAAWMARVWPSDRPRPVQRPFDAMYRCGIDRSPSDFDIQVSSGCIAGRVWKRIAGLGITPTRQTLASASYDFFSKDLVLAACPHLTDWALVQTHILGRPVTVAAFGAAGPRRVNAASSHFKETDWILLKENHGD